MKRKKTKKLIEEGDQAAIKQKYRLQIELNRKKEQKRGSGLLNEQIRKLKDQIEDIRKKIKSFYKTRNTRQKK